MGVQANQGGVTHNILSQNGKSKYYESLTRFACCRFVRNLPHPINGHTVCHALHSLSDLRERTPYLSDGDVPHWGGCLKHGSAKSQRWFEWRGSVRLCANDVPTMGRNRGLEKICQVSLQKNVLRRDDDVMHLDVFPLL
jgi:hypothetical protein